MTDFEKYTKAKDLLVLFELIQNKEQILYGILEQLRVSEQPDTFSDMYEYVYEKFPPLLDDELEDLEEAFKNKDIKKIAGHL